MQKRITLAYGKAYRAEFAIVDLAKVGKHITVSAQGVSSSTTIFRTDAGDTFLTLIRVSSSNTLAGTILKFLIPSNSR